MRWSFGEESKYLISETNDRFFQEKPLQYPDDHFTCEKLYTRIEAILEPRAPFEIRHSWRKAGAGWFMRQLNPRSDYPQEFVVRAPAAVLSAPSKAHKKAGPPSKKRLNVRASCAGLKIANSRSFEEEAKMIRKSSKGLAVHSVGAH